MNGKEFPRIHRLLDNKRHGRFMNVSILYSYMVWLLESCNGLGVVGYDLQHAQRVKNSSFFHEVKYKFDEQYEDNFVMAQIYCIYSDAFNLLTFHWSHKIMIVYTFETHIQFNASYSIWWLSSCPWDGCTDRNIRLYLYKAVNGGWKFLMKYEMRSSSRLLAQQYFFPKGLFLVAIPVGLGNTNLFLSWHIN